MLLQWDAGLRFNEGDELTFEIEDGNKGQNYQASEEILFLKNQKLFRDKWLLPYPIQLCALRIYSGK